MVILGTLSAKISTASLVKVPMLAVLFLRDPIPNSTLFSLIVRALRGDSVLIPTLLRSLLTNTKSPS